MKTFNPLSLLLAVKLSAFTCVAFAQQTLYQNLPEDVTPELSTTGAYSVGVKTTTITSDSHPQLFSDERTARNLTLEIWYPTSQSKENAVYENVTRNNHSFSIKGKASRNVEIAKGKYPLVVMSHGYTGYRHLMYYLGEHLASHGYVVAAIDHTGSTNEDIDFAKAPYAGFPGTLFNRSRDQQVTLDKLFEHDTFGQHINKDKAGLVGYSMGGYGLLSTLGGCYNFSPETAGRFTGVKDSEQAKSLAQRLSTCSAGESSNTKPDTRWAAGVALAPWGGQIPVFSKTSLEAIASPIMYIAGDLDDISGYQGIRWLFENTGSQGTQLLTLHNARHNIAAHPAPEEALGNELDIGHYYEPAWQTQTLNNITKHFVLAMMNCHVKQQKQDCSMLQVNGDSNQTSQEGKVPEPWTGFDNRYSTGMSMEHK